MNIIITGTSHVNGLGHLLAEKLAGDGHSVLGWTHNANTSKIYDEIDVDLRHNREVEKASEHSFPGEQVDILVNNAGVNRLNYLKHQDWEDWDMTFDVNVRAIALTTKVLLPRLIQTQGTVLNVGSSAAHRPMTASGPYNASKAAADMLTRQLARELGREHGIVVLGVNPNKLKGTEMSKSVDTQVQRIRNWTAEEAREYEHNNLNLNQETDPSTLADFLRYLLTDKQNHRYLGGCILPYGLHS